MPAEHIAVPEACYGKHVAYKSPFDHTIVAFGDDPVELMKRAHKMGHMGAMLDRIPRKDEINTHSYI